MLNFKILLLELFLNAWIVERKRSQRVGLKLCVSHVGEFDTRWHTFQHTKVLKANFPNNELKVKVKHCICVCLYCRIEFEGKWFVYMQITMSKYGRYISNGHLVNPLI